MDLNTIVQVLEQLESVCVSEDERVAVRRLAWLSGWMWLCECGEFTHELNPLCIECGGDRTDTEQ